MNTIEASAESCSMPREKVLEHVGGHHGVLLELGGEVFADHQAREVLEDLLIQGAMAVTRGCGRERWRAGGRR